VVIVFNKEQFADLILKAIGERTATQYADLSGVNRTYISKILNLKLNNPPSPDIIKRLSSVAHGNITYEELMIAADYLPKGFLITDADEFAKRYEDRKAGKTPKPPKETKVDFLPGEESNYVFYNGEIIDLNEMVDKLEIPLKSGEKFPTKEQRKKVKRALKFALELE
jgi:transcriptional regulator with XRE-family HTH domain